MHSTQTSRAKHSLKQMFQLSREPCYVSTYLSRDGYRLGILTGTVLLDPDIVDWWEDQRSGSICTSSPAVNACGLLPDDLLRRCVFFSSLSCVSYVVQEFNMQSRSRPILPRHNCGEDNNTDFLKVNTSLAPNLRERGSGASGLQKSPTLLPFHDERSDKEHDSWWSPFISGFFACTRPSSLADVFLVAFHCPNTLPAVLGATRSTVPFRLDSRKTACSSIGILGLIFIADGFCVRTKTDGALTVRMDCEIDGSFMSRSLS